MPMSRSAMLIASPIPRVPPVTIATRAMRSLRCLPLARLCFGQPARKFARDQAFQHCDALWRIIEAVEQCEMLPAGVTESLAAADSEFLESLDAIGGKTRRRQRNARDTLSGIGGKGRVGCGFEPFCAPELRLERHIDVATQCFPEKPGRLLAVAVIRIAEVERPRRHSVEAQEQP